MISSQSTFGDFILSLRSRMSSAPADTTSWFGVDIRKTSANDAGPSTGYRVYFRYNGSLEIYKGGVGVVSTKTTGITPNVWTHLKVIASGNNIKCYVNNTLYLNYSDSAFTSGYISILPYSNSLSVDFEGFLLQGVNNEYSRFLSESKDSLAATGLGTFTLKLAGRPGDMQSPNTVSWPLFATSDYAANANTIINLNSYTATWVQDGTFVGIHPSSAGVIDYRLNFQANTLHNPTQYVITVYAKQSGAGDNQVSVNVVNLRGGYLALSPAISISGTTNTKYTGTLTITSSTGTPDNSGGIQIQFTGNVSTDLLIDYVKIDFYRTGEFLGQEVYILHNGRPTFGGIVEDHNAEFSELGYFTVLGGTDFGWPLPKRLFTFDYGAAVSLDQIVRDILSVSGSGLTYAGGLNIGTYIQQNFENENALQLLLKVANFALYDYRIDFSKVLIFRPRGFFGPQSYSTSPTEAINIRSAKTDHSLKDMRNEIIVYYNKPTYLPSDTDSWTNAAAVTNAIFQAAGTITGLSVSAKTTGGGLNPPGTFQPDYIDMNWTNPPNTTYMQCYIFLNAAGAAPLNLRAWESMNFWYNSDQTGTAFINFTVTLMKLATHAGWYRVFNTSAIPANTWVLLGADAGFQLPTVANSRGWTPQNSPADNLIDTIMFSWFIQTGTGNIYIDGFNFSRTYSILQLDDLGSQNTYGLRGAYTYDKTRTDVTSASLLATGELAIKKYPSRKTEITVLGDETLQPAENIYVNSSSLNIGQQPSWIQEYYSIREVAHNWSYNGFLTDLKVTDYLIAGLDVTDVTKMLKDEILFTDRAAKGGTGGLFR